jgi:curved DNA-binding protein CbpA
MERRDPYRILQVQPDADLDVVKAAYRVLARKLHPDAGSPLDATRERKMADLNWAYSVARDPVKRSVWESDRRRAPPPTPAGAATHGAPRGPLSADGGDQRLDFGRYQGWTLNEVAGRDPEYLDWLRRHASGARYRDTIYILLRKHRSAAR